MLVKYLPSLLLHATTLTSDFSSPEGFHGKIWAVGNISICGSFENWTKSGFWSQKINVELVLKSSTSIKQCVSKDFERKIVIWSIWDLKKHSFNLIFVENHDFENEDDSHSMILFNVGVWWLNCPRPIWPSLLWIFDLRLSPWPAQTAPLSCTGLRPRWASVQLDLLWSCSVRAFQIEFGADFLIRARHHTLLSLLKISCKSVLPHQTLTLTSGGALFCATTIPLVSCWSLHHTIYSSFCLFQFLNSNRVYFPKKYFCNIKRLLPQTQIQYHQSKYYPFWPTLSQIYV